MTWTPDSSPKHPEIALLLAPPSRRIHLAFRTSALVLSLLGLALLLVPGALAHTQKSPCPAASAHRAHSTIAGRCVKHSTHKAKHHSHTPAKHKPTTKKPSHGPSKKSTAMTPATCEDGSLPVRARAGTQFTCSDGSEPACEGSTPTRSSTGSVPLCPVVADTGSDEGSQACEQEAEGECPAAGCEEASEACQAEPAEAPEG